MTSTRVWACVSVWQWRWWSEDGTLGTSICTVFYIMLGYTRIQIYTILAMFTWTYNTHTHAAIFVHNLIKSYLCVYAFRLDGITWVGALRATQLLPPRYLGNFVSAPRGLVLKMWTSVHCQSQAFVTNSKNPIDRQTRHANFAWRRFWNVGRGFGSAIEPTEFKLRDRWSRQNLQTAHRIHEENQIEDFSIAEKPDCICVVLLLLLLRYDI